MGKYRKKPIIVEAFQYNGDFTNADGTFYVPNWAKEAYEKGMLYFKGQAELYVKTLEGDHHASIGDYIIQGVNGELYPYKPDIFEKTYEIVFPDQMQKLEIIDGKGIFLNGIKIKPVIDWAINSDYSEKIVTLKLVVDELKVDCGYETRQKNLAEIRKVNI